MTTRWPLQPRPAELTQRDATAQVDRLLGVGGMEFVSYTAIGRALAPALGWDANDWTCWKNGHEVPVDPEAFEALVLLVLEGR